MEHAVLENEDKQPSNLTLIDGEEVGDDGEGARGGRPFAKALGDRAHHLLQAVDVIGYDVMARSNTAV